MWGGGGWVGGRQGRERKFQHSNPRVPTRRRKKGECHTTVKEES